MNKTKLETIVAEKVGLKRKDASEAVNLIFDTISESLSKGVDVKILGFGSFSVKERSARDGKNPRTGENIKIPASKSVRFKAGKQLKESANN